MLVNGIAALKLVLGLAPTSNSQDDLLSLLMTYADAAVKEYTGQNFEVQQYTEFYSGRGERLLLLNQRPILSVQAVYEDPDGAYGDPSIAFPATSILTPGVDYSVQWDYTLPGTQTQVSRAGLLFKIKSYWLRNEWLWRPHLLTPEPERQFGNYKITYTAGWPVIPQDVQAATVQWAALFRRTLPLGAMLQQENLGQYSYSVMQHITGGNPELGTIRQLLASYKELVF